MEQIAKAALRVQWFQPPPDVKNPEQIRASVQPDRAVLGQKRADRRDHDSGPGRAAAAIRPRPGREADARTVFRYHRSRHGQGRHERHDADRPDLPADQDRAEASRAADLHFRLERQFPGSSVEGNAGSAASRAIGDALGGRRGGGLGNRRSDRRGGRRGSGIAARRAAISGATASSALSKASSRSSRSSVPKASRCGRR